MGLRVGWYGPVAENVYTARNGSPLPIFFIVVILIAEYQSSPFF